MIFKILNSWYQHGQLTSQEGPWEVEVTFNVCIEGRQKGAEYGWGQ